MCVQFRARFWAATPVWHWGDGCLARLVSFFKIKIRKTEQQVKRIKFLKKETCFAMAPYHIPKSVLRRNTFPNLSRHPTKLHKKSALGSDVLKEDQRMYKCIRSLHFSDRVSNQCIMSKWTFSGVNESVSHTSHTCDPTTS